MNYTDIDPERTWLLRAACRADGVHPDVMFPDSDQARIADAKAICGSCPVTRDCFRDAVRTGDNRWGIRAGLTPDERRAVAKELERRRSGAEPDRARGKSYADLYAQHTAPAADGHLIWTGPVQLVNVEGKHLAYTRLAFEVGTGKPPYGPVKADCDRYRCVAPAHLTDATIRAARKAMA